MNKNIDILAVASLALALCGGCSAKTKSTYTPPTSYNMENMRTEALSRGLVAVKMPGDSVALSWRYLTADNEAIAFDILRNGVKINKAPITDATFYYDIPGNETALTYQLKDSATGMILDDCTINEQSPLGYISIPLDIPAPGVTPTGQEYTYTANDASIGDVDGDGDYEIFLKWDPTNSHDNAHDGYTGNVYIDCYDADKGRLWRIDLGRNIRAGAHYTQFMVYDFDGDGCAEMILKTADGTIDGLGNVIGDANADYREKGDPTQPRGGDFPAGDPRGKGKPGDPLRNQGRILSGPEFLTVFDGATGKALATVPYNPPRGNLDGWGDNRANRADRFLACVAYLDGVRPSAVMCRGYYTRSVLAAYDWDGKNLTEKWVFDSDTPGNEAYAGQGNHNVRVADVDGDGCDEIIYGQMAIDHDGKGLYTTGMGHGDAIHLTCFTPEDTVMRVWACHENRIDGSSFRDAKTGQVIWQVKNSNDVGRCLAADIDPTNYGLEMWSSNPKTFEAKDGSGGVRNVEGEVVNPDQSTLSINAALWWDGDLLRELLDHNTVSKYNWTDSVCRPMQVFEGCASNNGTKGNVCISGDLLGDWREEVAIRTADNSELRIYVSTLPTDYRFHTFLEDIPYRLSLAAQNTAYNQPPQPGFYFGSDFKKGTKVRGSVIK